MRLFRIFCISCLAAFYSLASQAQVDPLTGSRISVASNQSLLGAPPLPSLESPRHEYTIRGAYMIAKIDDPDSDASGKFRGQALGLGFSTSAKENLGFFGLAQANWIRGDLSMPPGGVAPIRNFAATGYAAAGGASYRLIGERNSKFAVGLFGGPAIMSSKSHFDIQNDSFESEAFMYGALVGAQIKFRIERVYFINPYILSFTEWSNECKKMTSNRGPLAGPGCGGDPTRLKLEATFWAWGVVLGYKGFQVNVYSKLENDKELQQTEMYHFSLSYTF